MKAVAFRCVVWHVFFATAATGWEGYIQRLFGKVPSQIAGTENHFENEKHWFQGMKKHFGDRTHLSGNNPQKIPKKTSFRPQKTWVLGESLVCSEGLPSTTWDKEKGRPVFQCMRK